MSQCKYIIVQVEKIVGRSLNPKEVDAVSEMYNFGYTTRQMACKVNQLAAIELGNQRREVHLKKLKKLGTTLNGLEMQKFKMQVDKEDGIVKDWEQLGYPTAYISDAVVKVVKKTKSKAKPKLSKKKKNFLTYLKTKKTKPQPPPPIKTCLDMLNSMSVVD